MNGEPIDAGRWPAECGADNAFYALLLGFDDLYWRSLLSLFPVLGLSDCPSLVGRGVE